MTNRSLTLSILAIVLVLFACNKDSEMAEEFRLTLPAEPYDYESTQEFPSNIFVNTNNPNDNFVSNHGATLGRVLFYDKRLSVTNKTSCASCHKQEHGFADDTSVSNGFFIENTRRNSPSLINSTLQNDYFWDGRISVLEDQVTMPISDHVEMGFEYMGQLVDKMEALNYYPPLFEEAFGTDEINSSRISMALGQFIRSLNSYNTKYDIGIQADFSNFTATELYGKSLFFEGLPCGSCHNNFDLGGWGWANIGLNLNYADNGVGEITPDPALAESGGFMIPPLRNISNTAPYMHDGRFETLEEVIRHYAQDVQPHPFLAFSLRQFGWNSPAEFDHLISQNPGGNSDPLRFNLSDSDVDALIQFLKTLEEEDLAQDERFSNPFQ